jgi:hypothetical protein
LQFALKVKDQRWHCLLVSERTNKKVLKEDFSLFRTFPFFLFEA